MSEAGHHHSSTCERFLDKLDAWLAGELASEAGTAMQAHHDRCAPCRQEARLAAAIDTVTRALPEHDLPQLARPLVRDPGSQPHRVTFREYLARLVDTWRQPLVFAPALLLVSLVVLLLLRMESAPIPQTVTVDGIEYSQAEILQAAADLEIALRYLDKYGSFPARLVHARVQDAPPEESGDSDLAPTI